MMEPLVIQDTLEKTVRTDHLEIQDRKVQQVKMVITDNLDQPV